MFFLLAIGLPVYASSDSTAIAQDTTMQVLTRPGLFDWLMNIPGDWWNWSKQTFTVKQLPVIAGLTAITAITIITDHDTWQYFKKPYDNNATYKNINDVTSFLGDGRIQFGLSLAFLAGGFVFNDSRAIRVASETVEVILASGGVVQLLKHVTGRQSPDRASTPTGQWDFFPNQISYLKHTPSYDAFPSGHITTALATLQVIIENYPREQWIKYIGYPIIGSIAVGLVSTSIHWWSDIPLGVALGYSFGILVSHPEEEKTGSHADNGLEPQMNFSVLGNGAPALGMSLRW